MLPKIGPLSTISYFKIIELASNKDKFMIAKCLEYFLGQQSCVYWGYTMSNDAQHITTFVNSKILANSHYQILTPKLLPNITDISHVNLTIISIQLKFTFFCQNRILFCLLWCVYSMRSCKQLLTAHQNSSTLKRRYCTDGTEWRWNSRENFSKM